VIRAFFIALIVAIANGYFFNWINDRFYHFETKTLFAYASRWELLFLVVIFAPVLETYLAQDLPKRILSKLKITSTWLLLLLPSIIFALAHWYFWLYAVMTFFSGLILNYFYLWAKRRFAYYILLTIGLHAACNLYGFLFTS